MNAILHPRLIESIASILVHATIKVWIGSGLLRGACSRPCSRISMRATRFLLLLSSVHETSSLRWKNGFGGEECFLTVVGKLFSISETWGKEFLTDRFEKLVEIDCYKNWILKIIIEIVKGIVGLEEKMEECFFSWIDWTKVLNLDVKKGIFDK